MSELRPNLQLNQIVHKSKGQTQNKQNLMSHQSKKFSFQNLKGECFRCGDEKHKLTSADLVTMFLGIVGLSDI